jgi:hypothetical protein
MITLDSLALLAIGAQDVAAPEINPAWSAHLPKPPAIIPEALVRAITDADYDALELAMLARPQADVPLAHHFAPGVYARECTLPAGALVLGHVHREGGLNIALSGEALVKVDGVLRRIVAPCILPSEAGTRKLAYIVKEMRWVNIHPTTETDLEKLEEILIAPSAASRALKQKTKEISP